MDIAQYTPYARYLLLILSANLVRGGVLPVEVAQMIAADPIIIEQLAGALVGIGTLVWYQWSQARLALKSAKDLLD